MKDIIIKLAFSAARMLNNRDIDHNLLHVKGGIARDVVTELDLAINMELQRVVNTFLPHAKYVSEENDGSWEGMNFGDLTVIVDPLDGSQNLSLGLPFSSVMVAIVEDWKLVASTIVSNVDKHIVYWVRGEGSWSNRELSARLKDPAPTYFAYSPIHTATQSQIFHDLLSGIDRTSTGIYRWGSASNGLLELMKGRLQGFVGLEIRIWDCISALPMLDSLGIRVKYRISGSSISLVASNCEKQLSELTQTFDLHGISLTDYIDSITVETND